MGTGAILFTSWYSSTNPLLVNGMEVLYVMEDVMSAGIFCFSKEVDAKD